MYIFTTYNSFQSFPLFKIKCVSYLSQKKHLGKQTQMFPGIAKAFGPPPLLPWSRRCAVRNLWFVVPFSCVSETVK